MVDNRKFVKGMRMQLGSYLRCNPIYTNAIGVESMATQMWSLLKLWLHNCDQSWKCGYKIWSELKIWQQNCNIEGGG
jgi:hypothetical protein